MITAYFKGPKVPVIPSQTGRHNTLADWAAVAGRPAKKKKKKKTKKNHNHRQNRPTLRTLFDPVPVLRRVLK